MVKVDDLNVVHDSFVNDSRVSSNLCVIETTYAKRGRGIGKKSELLGFINSKELAAKIRSPLSVRKDKTAGNTFIDIIEVKAFSDSESYINKQNKKAVKSIDIDTLDDVQKERNKEELEERMKIVRNRLIS